MSMYLDVRYADNVLAKVFYDRLIIYKFGDSLGWQYILFYNFIFMK